MDIENILVIGSKGQLGQEILELSKKYNKKFIFCDLPNIDITKKNSVENYVINKKIKTIINCAAYKNVSLAEIEKKKCLNVNDLAVKNLVEISENYKLKLIHFSTDYVYDSKIKKPICENEFINPINYYGYSKREGEKHVENSSIESIIIRTSWLYSKIWK